jgi:hypothetical protein
MYQPRRLNKTASQELLRRRQWRARTASTGAKSSLLLLSSWITSSLSFRTSCRSAVVWITSFLPGVACAESSEPRNRARPGKVWRSKARANRTGSELLLGGVGAGGWGGGACGWQQRGGAVKWVKWAACARVERPAAVGVDVIEHVVDLPQVVLGAATQPQQHRQAEVVLGEGDPVVHLVQHRALQVLEVVGRQLLIELSTQRRARNGLGAATQSTRGKDPIAAARPARSPAAGRSAPA